MYSKCVKHNIRQSPVDAQLCVYMSSQSILWQKSENSFRGKIVPWTLEYHTQLGTSFWNLYHTWWNLLREFDKACYPELCKKSFNEKICNWAIMAATNERVDQINQNKGGLEIGQLLSLFKSRQSSRRSTNIHIANGIFEFLDSIWFALSTFCSWKDISL